MFSREAVVKRPFPERWREMLRANAAFYAELSEADRERFEGLLDDFASSKRFELEIDPPEHELARVLVSAAACRLTLNLIETYSDRPSGGRCCSSNTPIVSTNRGV